MYRKNTASQYIYFCLVNATTGAALTGATVTAYRALDNSAQAAATGTTTELANGQYRFNLSQADTNAENGSYLFIATSAVPVEKTVVFTSANPSDSTAFGLSRVDATISSRMTAYTQPVGFLAATFPATVSSYAGGAVASVTAGVTVTTNNDKTGYSLTAGTGLGNQTANITGNLSGSVGSVTTVSTGAITTASFAAGAIDAAAIATDAIGSAEISAAAVTKIQAGLATPTNITAATGVVLSGVTHTGAVIPTVSTVTNGVTASTVSDKTGYSLTAGTGLGNQTSNITGNLSGSVGSVTAAVVLDSAARVKLHGTQDDYAPLKSSDYTAPLTAAATRTALGMSAADLDTQLDAILAAASAGAGTGARLVTITVNDGTTVLQNAVVRLTEGGNTYRALTNVSGVATFNVDDATYAVAISKVGYSYAGTTIVVNGVETATYSMTAINVTPGSGDLTTGYLTCLDELGAAEANVSVRCQVVQVPSSGTGYAYDSTVQIDTSAANGLVEFPMIKGARYLVWRGSIKPPEGIAPILISASAGSTTALGSLIGP